MNWKKIIIDDIETNYSISDSGQVKNNITNLTLSLQEQQGYKHTTLSINKKPRRFRVHRLVALMFIPNNDPLKNVVNHKDGNRSNNDINNLEWVTQQENTIHAWETRLAVSVRKKKVKQYDLNGNLLHTFDSITDAAIKTNSMDSKIVNCCQGLRNSHNDYFWRYEDDDDCEITNKSYTPPTKKKAVGQYDFNNNLINTYESATQAAKMINGTQSAITRCCNGKNNHHKGFIWKFIG